MKECKTIYKESHYHFGTSCSLPTQFFEPNRFENEFTFLCSDNACNDRTKFSTRNGKADLSKDFIKEVSQTESQFNYNKRGSSNGNDIETKKSYMKIFNLVLWNYIT